MRPWPAQLAFITPHRAFTYTDDVRFGQLADRELDRVLPPFRSRDPELSSSKWPLVTRLLGLPRNAALHCDHRANEASGGKSCD
jgi:hypothetical protein